MKCLHNVCLPAYSYPGADDVKYCRKCGLVFRDPMPTAEELDGIYASLYVDQKITDRTTHQESTSFALRAYAAFLKEKMSKDSGLLVDFGCGSGEMLQLLRENGIEAVGIETAPNARKYGVESRGLRIHSSASEVSWPAVKLVSMIEVIEHQTEPDVSLDELFQLMPNRSQLLITTPNRLGLRARISKGKWEQAQKKFHVVLFDRVALYRMLEAVGFTNIETVRFPPIQRPGVFHMFSTRVQQAIGLGGTLCVVARKL